MLLLKGSTLNDSSIYGINGAELNSNVYGVHVIDNSADISQTYSGNVNVVGDGIASDSDVSIYGVFIENNLNHTVDRINNSTFTLSGAPARLATVLELPLCYFYADDDDLALLIEAHCRFK